MKTKTVKRHWCDFCNKAGLQAHSMARHEKHCTLNPARECRVCTLLEISSGEKGAPLADLMALLPDYVPFVMQNSMGDSSPEYKAFCAALDAAIPALRDAAQDCPACIMAALRQKKIPVPMVDGFNFSGEMREIFNELNGNRDCGGYY